MNSSTAAIGAEDAALLAALRAGDEEAFARLVDRHHAALVRVARQYVPRARSQRTSRRKPGSACLRGLDGFEGRSSLRTYLFRIVMNLARTRGRARRAAPRSPRSGATTNAGPRSTPSASFRPQRWRGHWLSPSGPGAAAPNRSHSPARPYRRSTTQSRNCPRRSDSRRTLASVEGLAPTRYATCPPCGGQSARPSAPRAHQAAPKPRGLLRMTRRAVPRADVPGFGRVDHGLSGRRTPACPARSLRPAHLRVPGLHPLRRADAHDDRGRRQGRRRGHCYETSCSQPFAAGRTKRRPDRPRPGSAHGSRSRHVRLGHPGARKRERQRDGRANPLPDERRAGLQNEGRRFEPCRPCPLPAIWL